MRDIDKIQRQVHFMYAQAYDVQVQDGKQNTWIYNRAPEGYKFKLQNIIMSCDLQDTLYEGIVMMFDGHEYTHWNIWPGVETRELLARATFNAYMLDRDMNLHNWECKEYSIGVRSRNSTYAFKVCIIVWYYLEKMNYLETLYYAVIQPRWKRFKKAFATTLSRFEE